MAVLFRNNTDTQMKNLGFIRVAAAVPCVRIAETGFNTEEICRSAEEAFAKEASLVAFPELSVTGYSCGDLISQNMMIDSAEKGIRKILEFSRGKAMAIVVGAPVPYRSRLYNCAIVIRNGNIKGIVPKTYLTPEERNWFSSGSDFLSDQTSNQGGFLNNGKDCVREGFCGEIRYAGQRCNISPNLLFSIGKCTFAIEIGHDIWAPVPPSSFHVLQGAQVIVNLSADRELLMREQYRNNLLCQHSAKAICGYVYASAGFGESTQDNVYSGSASIWEAGQKLSSNERYSMEASLITADIDYERIDGFRRKAAGFCNISPTGTDASTYYRSYNRVNIGDPNNTDFEKKLCRHVEPHPFVPESDLDYRCQEILSMQTVALATRLNHIRCKSAVIGISGGLDSTLALLVTVLAADRLGWSRDRIVAVTMPGFGTTSRTKNNAWDLMVALGVACREISIVPACEQHFKDIGHDASVHDATYENSQARERTQLLMDIANQTGGIVVGTGDLSEMALGWATYNGDHMSMYGVNAGVPKTLVRSLVIWAAKNRFESVRDILLDIADTPISPELLPASETGEIKQVTEDLVGPYELHDFFIYNFMRNSYRPEKIYFLARKAFTGIYDDETIMKWLKTFVRRFFSQQFKRSCMPDGPKVGSVGLSPRGDWHMPSDAWSTIYSSEF